jgi:hypothetical protein
VLVLKSVGLTVELIKRLRNCFESVARFVDFHVVLVDSKSDMYSDFKHDSASLMKTLLDVIGPSNGAFDLYTCEQVRQEGLGLKYGSSSNYQDKAVPFPQNLLRNIALDAAKSKHGIVLDGDIVPSVGFGAAYIRAFDELAAHGHNMSHSVVVAPGNRDGSWTCNESHV